MKNKVWFFYSIPFIIIISFVTGAFYIREKLFPEAPAMECPAQNDIVSASTYSLSKSMGATVDLTAEDCETFLLLADNATPTRKQSFNDNPTVRPYYKVELKTENGEYRYFIYEDIGQVYIEIPYVGVYSADKELLDWVICSTGNIEMEESNTQNMEATEHWDLIPMVMVDGELYLDTGRESTIKARCGMMDGEIISAVSATEKPTIDNQSNFGTGYCYQYGATEGTIEVYMNEKWWVFATAEVD